MDDAALVRESLHQIRNQLSLITGHTSLIKDSQNLSEQERQDLHAILNATFSISHQLRVLEAACVTRPTASPDQ
ncbi:MAG: hypothetical protein RLZZ281_604 [Pseudomonadota bacterium]